MGPGEWSYFSECWVLSQHFYSHLSSSSRSSLVPLWFLPLEWVSSTCLRLLIFVLAILLPASDPTSPTFSSMFSAYNLNNPGNDIHFWWFLPNFEPFSCSMSGCNCCFLTCIHVYWEAGEVVWCSISWIFQFVVIHTVKGCSIIKEADVFLQFPCFFNDSKNTGSLSSLSSAISKSSLCIWKFLCFSSHTVEV